MMFLCLQCLQSVSGCFFFFSQVHLFRFWKFVVHMFNASFVSMFIFDVFMFVFMASMSLGILLFVYDVY
jgi:hypothetical protein